MGVMQVMRSLLMAQPHKETVVGDGIATFDTDFKALMKVVIPFAPVQEGTGDPSPDNVRPISGWTGCKIGNRGKNYFDYSKWNTIAKINAAGNTTYKPIAVPVPNGTYTVHSKFFNDSNKHGFYANIGKSASEKGTPDVNASQWMKHDSSSAYRHNTVTVNVTGGYLYINMYRANANALTWLSGLQVEAGSSATAYEEYKAPQALPITFTNPSTGDPLTVYGGTVTLNEDGSADLVSDRATFKIGECSTYQSPTVGNKYAAQIFRAKIQSIGNVSYDSKTGAVSDQLTEIRAYFYKHYPDRVESDYDKPCFAFQAANNGVYSDYFCVYVADTTLTTAAAYKEAVKDIEICVKLPISARTAYHFPNVGQLKSFLGTNNVCSDLNGDPTVTFWKHG